MSVFQQLPLAVRSRVLKEGKLLFVRDEDALYELAIRTARAWERSARSTACTSTTSPVIDRDRLLVKLDELDGYLRELRSFTKLAQRGVLASAMAETLRRMIRLEESPRPRIAG